MIYLIGDSHVSIFSGVDSRDNGEIHIQPEWNYCYTIKEGKFISLRLHNDFKQEIDNICAIKLGSYTAYNLQNKLEGIHEIINAYNITSSDILLFVFGEIDIRAHIGFKSEENNEPIGKTIKRCVDRYLEVLVKLKNNGLNVGVFAPAASLPNELVYNIGRNYGDSQIRNKITTKFNEYLESECLFKGFIFRDIHKELIRDDYSSDPIYFKDNIHLSIHALPFIKKELKTLL